MARLYLEHRERPLTLNVMRQGAARWALSNELRKWREEFAWVAKASRAKPLTPPVRITARHFRKNRAGMPDTGASILAVKACIDSLVDVGVLPHDGPAVVQELRFLAPEVVGYDGLGLEVVELDATS